MARLGSGEVLGLLGGDTRGERLDTVDTRGERLDTGFLWPGGSADRGQCSLSGLSARLSSGDPGSVDLGREKDFLLSGRLDWVF